MRNLWGLPTRVIRGRALADQGRESADATRKRASERPSFPAINGVW